MKKRLTKPYTCIGNEIDVVRLIGNHNNIDVATTFKQITFVKMMKGVDEKSILKGNFKINEII